MYNGIGLPTPRGSGTNGYIQRNLACIVLKTENKTYNEDGDRKHPCFKEPNKEILLHEKKRKIELKCLELENEMEEQGYTSSEISEKVTNFRKHLLEKLESTADNDKLPNTEKTQGDDLQKSKGTHETSLLMKIKNDVFKQALGINPEFVEGSSMRIQATKQAEVQNPAQTESLPTVKSSEGEDSDDSESERHRKRKRSKKKSHKKHKKHKKYSTEARSSSSPSRHSKKRRHS